MPTSPSSSAQAARQRLGGQLRDMRTAAGLTGRDFASAAGWADASSVTKIEKGQRSITSDHVRLWCRLCGATERRQTELLAEQANVAGMWLNYRQLSQVGLKGHQDRIRSLYDDVRLFREYQTKVHSGLLQTPAMAGAYLTQARLEQHLDIDDVSEAVVARMDRQTVLNRPDARWLFLIEEDVLWYRPASDEIHAEQLRHLLHVMRHPTISFGVIPRRARRGGVCPEESFVMYDRSLVAVELISGYLNLVTPYELQMYAETWDRLSALAVYGDRAAALVQEVMADLEP